MIGWNIQQNFRDRNLHPGDHPLVEENAFAKTWGSLLRHLQHLLLGCK